MKFNARIISAILVSIFALLLVTTRTGCGPYDSGSDDITVLVTVEGLTGSVSSLSVSTTLNGTASLAPIPDLTQRLDKFAIFLPRKTSGVLAVSLVGHSADNCVVAKGQAEVEIKPAPPTFVRLSVPISSSAVGATKQCALKVELYGTGSVSSMPAGISCSATNGKAVTCTGDFPVGTQVTLNSTVDSKVYGVSFDGLCKGAGSCSFMFNAPGTVRIGFGSRVCSKDNWCWYTPLPQGNTLRAIWGRAADDIWAVGDLSTILHFDGGAWSGGGPSGLTASDLYAVYGTSNSDVWAVGTNSGLIRYDGNSWKASPQSGAVPSGSPQSLRGIWGSAANDYWAVGSGGVILRFNGTTWAEVTGSRSITTAQLNAIWGSAPDDIWAVGSGVILRYNGTSWAVDTAASNLIPGNGWNSVSGTAKDRVIVTGNSGRILRYNGTTWSVDAMSGSNGLSTIYGVSATANGAIAVGYASVSGIGGIRLDNNAWQFTGAPGSYAVYGVYASSLTDAWAIGDLGLLLRYDGQAWTAPAISAPNTNYTLFNVWGNAPDDVWAVGSSGNIRHFDGQTWSASPSGTTNALYNVWGANPSSVYAVGSLGTFLRYNGNVWSAVTGSGTVTNSDLRSVWGSSDTSVWAVGAFPTAIVSYNGTSLTLNGQSNVVTTGAHYGIHGVNASNIMAVGNVGQCPSGGMTNCNTVRYFSFPLQWYSQTVGGASATASLRAIWGIGTPAVRFWGVGTGGALTYFDGATWTTPTQSATLTTSSLNDIWGTAANNVMAVGNSPNTVLRYDGTTWSLMESGVRSYTLYGIWTGATNDAWIVGGNGLLMRYMP